MITIKTLWSSVQGNPVFMRRVNGWATNFCVLLVPTSFLFGWVDSVRYVSALSLWALVSGHLSAWQAARVEVNQDRDANVREVLEHLRRLEERWEAEGRWAPVSPDAAADLAGAIGQDIADAESDLAASD